MTIMKKYDIAILGTGISGLLLLNFLLDKGYEGKILLIDKSKKTSNDKVISFWTEAEMPLVKSLPCRKWERLKTVFPDRINLHSCGTFKYYSFDSIYFYKYILDKASSKGSVTFIHSTIHSTINVPEGVVIHTDRSQYLAEVAFKSIHSNEELKSGNYIYQNFLGIKIKTDKSVFDPSAPIFMDFRNSSPDILNFHYIIPYSSNEALIDSVIYTTDTVFDAHQILNSYISDTLNIQKYTKVYVEGGKILLTDRLIKRQTENLYNIGTPGGMINPLTGYGFTNMLEDADFISERIVQGQRIVFKKKDLFYQIVNSLFINLVKDNPKECKDIFQKMFNTENIEYLLKFLNEKSNLKEIFKGNKVPLSPFLPYLLKLKLR
jgi:lycopene beta-cyclase